MTQPPVSLPDIELRQPNIAVKYYAKVDIEFLQPCPILLDFFILYQIFCLGLQFHFTCGERKLCQNVKKSPNILSKIAELNTHYKHLTSDQFICKWRLKFLKRSFYYNLS